VQFIETPIFTKQITELLDDSDYRRLQIALARKPDAGNVIRNSNGLRKIRWSAQGRGKRGGIRVIYYKIQADEIYMLLPIPRTNKKT
jgi:mRNA-degrading endonuclease RelE of RelBE toxin-antitoxin system